MKFIQSAVVCCTALSILSCKSPVESQSPTEEDREKFVGVWTADIRSDNADDMIIYRTGDSLDVLVIFNSNSDAADTAQGTLISSDQVRIEDCAALGANGTTVINFENSVNTPPKATFNVDLGNNTEISGVFNYVYPQPLEF